MTNPAHIVETALLLLAAYLVGCTLGYATRRILHAARGTRQVTVPPVAVANVSVPEAVEPRRPRSPAARLAARVDDLPPTRPVVAPPLPKPVATKPLGSPRSADPRPLLLAAPRDGGPDNLKRIKGIGPKIEASLYAMGIHHFDQIAGWTPGNIDWVDAQLAFKGRIRRERWVEQAVDLTQLRASA